MSGNVWMFSDEIDDEDLEFMRHDYVTYNMACEYYRLGIKPVVRMAHEAGAVYKIGKKVLIRRTIRFLLRLILSIFVLVKWNNYWVIRQKQRLCLVGIQRRPVFLNW